MNFFCTHIVLTCLSEPREMLASTGNTPFYFPRSLTIGSPLLRGSLQLATDALEEQYITTCNLYSVLNAINSSFGSLNLSIPYPLTPRLCWNVCLTITVPDWIYLNDLVFYTCTYLLYWMHVPNNLKVKITIAMMSNRRWWIALSNFIELNTTKSNCKWRYQ